MTFVVLSMGLGQRFGRTAHQRLGVLIIWETFAPARHSTVTMKFTTPALATLLSAPSMIDAWSIGRSPYSLMRPMVICSPNSMIQETLNRQRALMNRGFIQTSPRYEITDTDEKFQVAVDVPGMKADDIAINFEEDGQVLSISGTRESSSENYRFTSKFSQSFSIDPAVDVDKFTANLENGVLIISAPKDLKRIEANVRSIPITMSAVGSTEEVTATVEVESKADDTTDQADETVDPGAENKE